MKLQAIEVPPGKNQTRRKTPKKARLVTFAILFAIIPIFYRSHKKLSIPFEASVRPTSFSDDPCPIRDTNDDTTSSNPRESHLVVEEEIPPRPTKHDLPPEKDDVGRRSDQSDRLPTGRKGRPGPKVAEEKEGIPRSVGGRPTKGESYGIDKCDIFSGEWVPNLEAPYYTNTTCWAIQEHQNCMKYGRPDTGFMKWRWKPHGCDLPVFDPHHFLELMRGKSLAFVGDSVARNHMQSLICLLSRVVYPVDVSDTSDENFKRWEYRSYNFTIVKFWSPYLVRTQMTNPNDTTRPFNLFLDEYDKSWTTQIENFDYVIISAFHWFARPSVFYVNRRVIGCLYCPETNIAHKSAIFSYRRALRTAFRAINSLKRYRGVTFVRTFAPSHFEGGPWDKGGDCARKRPFMSNEIVLEGENLKLYEIQVGEHKIAEKTGRRRGLKFRLMDLTQAMWLRPDGHPSKYGHWPVENVVVANDCVHWCLPGPIDTWNDFLLEMLKREGKSS
ncbi:hypothetical protein RJ639_016281 [Escallonia herrerae]|uniref:Trichome birefringence-like N-terminal domain-containing protein n=1 Tax=Escallonia herrerae TaxID=1293975 RepID=A0AA88VHA1_9ASTE|nr:hypothetical protein RJ639_016281 [Escallonia herrerae]